jgi:hypothetical protein
MEYTCPPLFSSYPQTDLRPPEKEISHFRRAVDRRVMVKLWPAVCRAHITFPCSSAPSPERESIKGRKGEYLSTSQPGQELTQSSKSGRNRSVEGADRNASSQPGRYLDQGELKWKETGENYELKAVITYIFHLKLLMGWVKEQLHPRDMWNLENGKSIKHYDGHTWREKILCNS